jgi:hypothetical protein
LALHGLPPEHSGAYIYVTIGGNVGARRAIGAGYLYPVVIYVIMEETDGAARAICSRCCRFLRESSGKYLTLRGLPVPAGAVMYGILGEHAGAVWVIFARWRPLSTRLLEKSPTLHRLSIPDGGVARAIIGDDGGTARALCARWCCYLRDHWGRRS